MAATRKCYPATEDSATPSRHHRGCDRDRSGGFQWLTAVSDPRTPRRDACSGLLLLVGLVLNAVAIGLFAVGHGRVTQYSGLPLALWLIAASVYFAGGFLLGSRDVVNPPFSPPRREGPWQIWLLGLVVVLGLSVRLVGITSVPNGCQVDEAAHGLQGEDFLDGSPYVPYLAKYQGRGTLYPYLAGLTLRVLGHGVPQLRTTSALLGTLTIAVFFFLARPLTGAPLALALTVLLAVSRWHITFSRIAFETILDPLATVLLLTFLLRALRNGCARDWALAGGSLAFGLNGYLAFRAAALAMVVFLGIEFARRRRRVDARGVALMLGGFFVTISPLAVYAFQNPEALWRRARVLSVWNDVREAGGSLLPVAGNLLKTLGCLHLRGDESPINNLPGAPLLDPVTGAVVLLGFAWAFLSLRDPVARLVILWTGAVGSLDVLSNVSEAPSARRIIGLLPVLLLAGGMALREVSRRSSLRVRRASVALLGGCLVFAAWFNLSRYFVTQAKHPDVWGAFSVDGSALAGELLRSLPADTAFYFSPIWPVDVVVDFVSKRRPYSPLNVAATYPPGGSAVYALTDCRLASEMARLCPEANLKTHRDLQGEAVLCSVWADARTRASCAPELFRNGLVGHYYRGVDPAGRTEVVQRDPLLYANDVLPAPFGIVWQGALAAPVDGVYRFRTEADDGALLLLDGQVVVDNGGSHAVKSREAEVFLERGYHAIELRYWQTRGARHLGLYWQPNGRIEALISPRFLLPVAGPVPPCWPVPELDSP